ncbi:hypothetical protein WH47_06007, partial [Habropoda laboriosa]
NTHPHACTASMVKSNELKYNLYPPYSPDLAPSDFHLFPRLKKHSCQMRNFILEGSPGSK